MPIDREGPLMKKRPALLAHTIGIESRVESQISGELRTYTGDMSENRRHLGPSGLGPAGPKTKETSSYIPQEDGYQRMRFITPKIFGGDLRI